MSKRLAIFASGNGTNAENIINYFQDIPEVEVTVLVASKPDAFAIQRARKFHINSYVITKNRFQKSDDVLVLLHAFQVDFIVLAGFMWLIPAYLIQAYPEKIINIHPALLPAYGGKGMYGNHVHKAVKDDKVAKTGISIHLVNEKYDEGEIIFQAECPVLETDQVEDIASKVHQLEYQFFPKVIHSFIQNTLEKPYTK